MSPVIMLILAGSLKAQALSIRIKDPAKGTHMTVCSSIGLTNFKRRLYYPAETQGHRQDDRILKEDHDA